MASKTSPLSSIDNKVYRPVGRCIYCGAADHLEKEHILPFGLSGTAILPKSSCRACASITGNTEQSLLRGAFWPLRVFRDLKSRSKHRDAPKTFPMYVEKSGVLELIELPIDELPIILHFPLFAPPAYISGAPLKAGIDVSGLATVHFGQTPREVANAHGTLKLQFEQSQKPVDFARMIAKIAYSFAVAEGAVDDMEGTSFVLPAILDRPNEIGQWVGTLTDPIQSHPGQLHRIIIHHDVDRGLLCGEVQLFADSETPSYGVILGKLRSKSSNPSIERTAVGKPSSAAHVKR